MYPYKLQNARNDGMQSDFPFDGRDIQGVQVAGVLAVAEQYDGVGEDPCFFVERRRAGRS